MNIARLASFALFIALLMLFAGCKQSGDSDSSGGSASNGLAHTHDDGTTHADHDETEDHEGEDHAHDEVSLGTVTIGDMEIELDQGHGAVEAGMEGHLVVKLPYTDNGATIVRAWIGTEDRTMSMVGLGDYARSHDDYDIHAMAPDPLPANAMWWIEIEKPDGTKVVGSAKPIIE